MCKDSGVQMVLASDVHLLAKPFDDDQVAKTAAAGVLADKTMRSGNRVMMQLQTEWCCRCCIILVLLLVSD